MILHRQGKNPRFNFSPLYTRKYLRSARPPPPGFSIHSTGTSQAQASEDGSMPIAVSLPLVDVRHDGQRTDVPALGTA
jgi:hypothetical protein